MLLHALFAYHQPFTNDEGAYLYDARTILRGSLPGGDALVKTPVVIFLFAAGEFMSSQSLFAARMASVLASVASAWPLFLFMNRIAGRKAAQYAALIWLLGSGPIIFQSMGHTQAIANFFSISALASVVSRRMVLAGVFFALAYASRKISITLLAPIMMIFLLDTEHMRVALLRPFLLAASFLLGIYALGGYVLYGIPGVLQALGAGYGNILAQHAGGGFDVPAWGGGMDRFSAVLMRAGLPYVLLIAIASVLICWIFFSRKEMRNVWIAIPVSYGALLGILYALWPVLLPEYIADFLLPLTMIGAFVFSYDFSWKQLKYGIVICVAIASAYSLVSVYRNPWTGMFSRAAIFSASSFLQERAPAQDEIFTAAVIIPYVSGHTVPYNVSHPQWYRYGFISQAHKEAFLPQQEEVLHTSASWALREQLTEYAYPKAMYENFSLVETVENNTTYRNNPLMIYAR